MNVITLNIHHHDMHEDHDDWEMMTLNDDCQVSSHEQRGADRDVALPGREEGD